MHVFFYSKYQTCHPDNVTIKLGRYYFLFYLFIYYCFFTGTGSKGQGRFWKDWTSGQRAALVVCLIVGVVLLIIVILLLLLFCANRLETVHYNGLPIKLRPLLT